MATFYVSDAIGNDSHTSLQAQNPATPKKTINAGVGCLSAGDTLIVRAGTYHEALNANTIPSGTGPSGVTTITKFAGDPNPEMLGNVWISTRSYITWDGIDINGINNGTPDADGNMEQWTNVFINGGTDITFKNCEIYNAQKLGILTGDGNGQLTNIRFINLKVHDCGIGGYSSPTETTGGHGFYISAANFSATGLLVDGCESYNNGQHPNTWGIQVYAAADNGFLNGVVVKNCYIHDNTNGLVIGSGNNHQAYNNIIYNNGSGGDGEGAITISYGTCDNIQIYNNTIVGNAAYAVDIGRFNSPTNTLIKNNIFWQNGNDSVNLLGGSGTVSSNNSSTDPLFISPGSDFHLSASSPAIGAGVNLSSVFTTDKDGNTRPASDPWALGAYETGSGEEGGGTGGGGGEEGGGGGGGVGAGSEEEESSSPPLQPPGGGNLLPKIVYPSGGGSTLNFLYPPRMVPWRDYEAVRGDNVSFAGQRESVYTRRDDFFRFTMEHVRLGDDIAAWNRFMRWALAGDAFDYYPDSTLADLTVYKLDSNQWKANYRDVGSYQFATRFRKIRTVPAPFAKLRPLSYEVFDSNPPVNPARTRVIDAAKAIDFDPSVSTYAELQMDSCTSVLLGLASLLIYDFPAPPGPIESYTIHIIAEYIPGIQSGHADGPTYAGAAVYNQRQPNHVGADGETGRIQDVLNASGNIAAPKAEYTCTIAADSWADDFGSDASNIWVRFDQYDSGNFTFSSPSRLLAYDCWADYELA